MSPFNAYDWNIVLLGAWNRAILTPNYISAKLFGLSEGDGIEVFVPVDVLAPIKVRHQGLSVIPNSSRLIIETSKHDFDSLNRAKDVAKKALEELPLTPVGAVGYNIRFKGTKTNLNISEGIQLTLDPFSDEGFEVSSNGVLYRLSFREGWINLKVDIQVSDLFIELNFHRESREKEDLSAWLDVPIDEVKEAISKISKALGVKLEEQGNG